MSERDEHRHVATGDAAPASPTVRDPATDPDRPVEAPATGEGGEGTDRGDTEVDVLQAVVDFIGDLVESDDPGGAGRAHGDGDGDVSPEPPPT